MSAVCGPCPTAEVPRSHGVLLSENSYRGVGKLAIGLLRPFGICCNSIGLTLQRVPVADTPPVVGKPELVVAYEGTLRISLRKDGAGLPPQGRTVRAGAALPPGGARLLFCNRFPRPATSVAVVAVVAAFLVYPFSLWCLSMNVHVPCRPS